MMLDIEHHKTDIKKTKIAEVLKQVGLKGYEGKKVFKCSGGEQQCISVARLLLKPCELVLADEPTGSLNEENKKIIFIIKIASENGGNRNCRQS